MDKLTPEQRADVEKSMKSMYVGTLTEFHDRFVAVANGNLLGVVERHLPGGGGLELRYNDELTDGPYEVLGTGGDIEALRELYSKYLQLYAAFALYGGNPISDRLSTSRAWVADADGNELEQFNWHETI